MEYQEIINFSDNTTNRQTKLRTKNWVKVNDNSHGTRNTNSQFKFKTSVLRSSLIEYSDANMLVNGNIRITGAGVVNTNM